MIFHMYTRGDTILFSLQWGEEGGGGSLGANYEKKKKSLVFSI